MYTHTQCPICDKNGIKDDHALQVVRLLDLYEKPFLHALGFWDEKKQEYINPSRAYCDYHNDYVSDWLMPNGNTLSNLYDLYTSPIPRPLDFGDYQASLSSRLNLPHLHLLFQSDFAISRAGVLFIRAIFILRNRTKFRYGFYLIQPELAPINNETKFSGVTFVNCQEINTGKIQKTKFLNKDDFNQKVTEMISSDFAQWQILEGQ